MPAFRMTRLASTGKVAAMFTPCSNGCVTSGRLRAEADMAAVYLETHVVPLCRDWARIERRAWENASTRWAGEEEAMVA